MDDKVKLIKLPCGQNHAFVNADSFCAHIGVRGTRVWIKSKDAFYINNNDYDDMTEYFKELNEKNDSEEDFFGDDYLFHLESLDDIIHTIETNSTNSLEKFRKDNSYSYEVDENIEKYDLNHLRTSSESHTIINNFDDFACCVILPNEAYVKLLGELKEVNEYCKKNNLKFYWV